MAATLADYYPLRPPRLVLPFNMGWTMDSFVGISLVILLYLYFST